MCDMYICGDISSKCYKGKPKTLEELKSAIQNQIEQVNNNTLKTVHAHFLKQFQNCFFE